MAQQALGILVRRLRHLTGPLGSGGLTDAELLHRFVTRRDEAAFEVLVWRHGGMVLSLCRRLLRHEQDAEDAFQATFLTLVRKGSTIGKRGAVGSWLYKVAYRIALAARAVAVNRAAREQTWVDLPARESADDSSGRDLRRVLDEEVQRLPDKYRAPFVLCYLEGKTNEEAARQLGCPKGTVLSRLSRARERLRLRLTRRGIALSAGLLATGAAEQGRALLVPVRLVDSILNAALGVAAGKAATALVSSRVAALTEGALRAMFMAKLKFTLVVLLVLGVGGTGVGTLGAWMFTHDSGIAQADEQELALAQQREGPAPGLGQTPPRGRRSGGAEDPALELVRRQRSQNNLKQIGLALYNYHDTFNRFPPPAIYSKDRKPLLSWRVAILPFVEQDNLYKQFKLDEPWDSPSNKPLLNQMPSLFAPVGALFKEPDQTYYQALVGKGAAFEPGNGIRVGNFTDGTSSTILIVEAGSPVPWTKPEDLPYVPDQALPKFGGLFQGNFNALFADGSVHYLTKDADPDTLRAVITRGGNEVINFDKLHAPLHGPAGGGKLDLNDIPKANARLQAALQNILREVTQAKEDIQILKDRLALGIPRIDKKTQKLLEQNEKLQEALLNASGELEQLKAEKARLEKDLKKRSKE